jgi:hypothetical protein
MATFGCALFFSVVMTNQNSFSILKKLNEKLNEERKNGWFWLWLFSLHVSKRKGVEPKEKYKDEQLNSFDAS